jgi:hypothetical protein
MFGVPTTLKSKTNRLAIVRRLAEHSLRLGEAKAAIGTKRVRVESISALMTASIQRALTQEASARRPRTKPIDPVREEAS